ncbi:uncharacterized protein LOC117900531 [Drosophila subobscura]|uniref:uncharacterized protein LOC117900531 n=1 Tax=Drosophila subobscura TaxID=7241 RepID=UPI00155A4126|nr:uncharacterized protein LOC117900531 [Drosophila subobscura]
MPYLKRKSNEPPPQSLAVTTESIRVGRMRAPNIIDHGMRPKLSKLPSGQDINRTRYRLSEHEKAMWVTTDTEVIGVEKKYMQQMGKDLDNYFNPKLTDNGKDLQKAEPTNKDKDNDKKLFKAPKLATIQEEALEENIDCFGLLKPSEFINTVELQSGAKTANALRKSLQWLQEATRPGTVQTIDNVRDLHRSATRVCGTSTYRTKKEIGVLSKKKMQLNPKAQLIKEKAERMEAVMNEIKMYQDKKNDYKNTEKDANNNPEKYFQLEQDHSSNKDHSYIGAIEDLYEMTSNMEVPQNSDIALQEFEQNERNCMSRIVINSQSLNSSDKNNNSIEDCSVIYKNDNILQNTDSTTTQSENYFGLGNKKHSRKHEQSRSKYNEIPKIYTGYSVTNVKQANQQHARYQSLSKSKKAQPKDLNMNKYLKPFKSMKNIQAISLDTLTKAKDNVQQIKASFQLPKLSKCNGKYNSLTIFHSKSTVQYLVCAPTLCLTAIFFLSLVLFVRFVFVKPAPTFWERLLKYLIKKLRHIYI